MLERVIVTAILARPIRPAKSIWKPFGHAVGALSVELRWALDFRKVVLGQILKIKLMSLRLLNLALERIQTVCKFFDVADLLSVCCDKGTKRPDTNPLLGPRFMGCLLN